MSLRKDQSGFSPVQSILIVLVILAVAGAGWLVYNRQNDKKPATFVTPQKTINSFDECVAAGNPVMETYPEQCAANGKTFTKEETSPLTAKAEWTTFSKVPVTLQTQIIQTYKDKAPACLKDGKIIDFEGKPADISVLYSSTAAEALIGCDGGFRALYVQVKQEPWKFVLGSQSGIPCETIVQYAIPESLLKIDAGPGQSNDNPTCYDKDGNSKKYSELYL